MESIISLKNDTFLRDYIKNNLMKNHKTLGQRLQIEISEIKKLQKELFCELLDTYGIYEIDKIAQELGYQYNKTFIGKMIDCEVDKIIEEKRDRVFERQYIIDNLQEKSSVLAKKLFLMLSEVREIKRNYLKELINSNVSLSYEEIVHNIGCSYSKFKQICTECKVKVGGLKRKSKDNLIDLVDLKLKIKEGYSFSKLEKYFQCSCTRIKRIMKDNNLELLNPRKILKSEDKENIVIDYNNGISIPQIMEKYCTSESRIRKILIGKCIFDKKNYELNDAEMKFLKENAPNMTLKELSMKLGRKGSTLRTILGILKIKYKARNCKGELWEWKGFNG
ncbi:hypothetical protein KSU07_07670 [Fusobacterium animalis]|uniref:hypothetical protein n=1 Tax=Fusobacterium animalis TaxID=76859 RepID=UPI0030CE5C84